MVLRALGTESRNCNLSQLRSLVPTSSVWTVDLAYLLSHFGLKFTYLTTTIGANPDYKSEAFYSSALRADSVRVNLLFAEAEKYNLDIEQRSLSSDELKGLLQTQQNLVVALVDRRHLYKTVGGLVESCISKCLHTGYVGHYVVVCDLDEERGGYYVKDPAKCSESCFVCSEDLETARRSFGTDEDLLVISLNQQPTQQPTKVPALPA